MSGGGLAPLDRRWYQYSPRGLFIAISAAGISIGMFYYAFFVEFWQGLFTAIVGLILLGGVIGAAVGYAEDPQYSSMVHRRAISGALLFGGLALLGIAAFILVLWMTFRNFSVAG